jgi:hypothetical protein
VVGVGRSPRTRLHRAGVLGLDVGKWIEAAR